MNSFHVVGTKKDNTVWVETVASRDPYYAAFDSLRACVLPDGTDKRVVRLNVYEAKEWDKRLPGKVTREGESFASELKKTDAPIGVFTATVEKSRIRVRGNQWPHAGPGVPDMVGVNAILNAIGKHDLFFKRVDVAGPWEPAWKPVIDKAEADVTVCMESGLEPDQFSGSYTISDMIREELEAAGRSDR